jgi:hypothetical protein
LAGGHQFGLFLDQVPKKSGISISARLFSPISHCPSEVDWLGDARMDGLLARRQ